MPSLGDLRRSVAELKVIEAAKFAKTRHWIEGLPQLDQAVAALNDLTKKSEESLTSDIPSEPDAVSTNKGSATAHAEKIQDDHQSSTASGPSKFKVGDRVWNSRGAWSGVVTDLDLGDKRPYEIVRDDTNEVVWCRTWFLQHHREALIEGYKNDSREDPVDNAIADITEINRKKRADYTSGDDPFQNFKEVATETGRSVEEVFDVMIAVKNARIRSLRANDREPQNESLTDSLLDRAVYSVLAYAYAKENQR